MRKVKFILSALALAFTASSAHAEDFKGNWTETFSLKDGHYVVHTPDYVSFDGLIRAGEALNLDTILNGTRITNFHVKTDSTRDEFVQALRQSNLYS